MRMLVFAFSVLIDVVLGVLSGHEEQRRKARARRAEHYGSMGTDCRIQARLPLWEALSDLRLDTVPCEVSLEGIARVMDESGRTDR